VLSGLPTLVLASASPRRAELLSRLSLPFEVKPAYIDEDLPYPAAQLAQTLAVQKARAVWKSDWVLAADTVVALGENILGKPKNAQQNKDFLALLSGQSHTVYTGFALATPGGEMHSELAATKVYFRNLEPWEIDWYAASQEGLDKAGGYGAQGLGMVLVERLEGDFYTVMGLPISQVWQRLGELGYFGL
jgi:septum formation protein